MGRKGRYQDNGEIHGLQVACYHAVYDYELGLKSFLDAAGISRDKLQVWQKKLAAHVHTHYLNPYDIELIIEVTKDERILQSVGHLAGVVWVDAAKAKVVPGDVDLIKAFSELNTSAAAVPACVAEALANDGEIDDAELKQLQALQQALDEKQAVLDVVVDHFRSRRGA